MRRTSIVVLTALTLLVGLAATVIANGASTVTQARVERSLQNTFANLYVAQAHLLGRRDVTPVSLHAMAMCDKHGPDVADVGPGGDWICLMSWTDPQVPMPNEGYGKFELNVHSNDCYTAAGPTKLTGFLTITDVSGNAVTNPVFEFDGCFDPNGNNTPTGATFPSVFNAASPSVTPDTRGRIGLKVSCGTGINGCSGAADATAGDVDLGTVRFSLKEEATATLSFPRSVSAGTKEVTISFAMSDGIAGSESATIPVESR